jgi:hypothetical protein
MFRRLCFSFLVLSICFSCKKLLEKPSWKTNVSAPLISSKLTLSDVIKDTAFHKNADSSITIVENKLLYSFGLDSLVKLSVPPYTKSVKLSSLKLDSQVIIRNISLGEIANQLIASGGSNAFIGGAINSSNGGFTCIPAFSGISAGPFPIDISAYFQTATMITGTMDVTITNNLSLTIQSIDYDIRNHTAGTKVFTDVFNNLTPGSSQTNTQSLATKTVEGKLDVVINNMAIAGACPVYIDTSKTIQIKIKISNVSVSSATAVFPTQDVIRDSSGVSLVGMKDVELTSAKLKGGTIIIDSYSTVMDTIFFTYGIPGAVKNGQPLIAYIKMPPSIGGVASHASFQYDFSGYDLDLRGQNHDTVNTFYNTIRGRINYTGIQESFSLQDSIYVVINFNNIEPSYVKGFLGQDTLTIGPSEVSMDIFKNISGNLNFESVKASLIVRNGIGVDGDVTINNITTTNTRTGVSQTLTGSTLGVSKPIGRATDIPALETATPALDTIDLGSGTNITSLLGILPDKITYQALVNYNPNGKPASSSSYNDFAYSNVTLEPYLELEIPLSLITSNLVLSDTVDFNGKDHETAIKNGDFNILVENGFPFNADLKLYFLSSAGTVLDSMVSPNSIKAAPIAGSPRVTGNMYSKVPFHLDQSRLNNILHAYKIVFRVKFSTASLPGTFVKIYSDYSIDFKLTGDFDYQVK